MARLSFYSLQGLLDFHWLIDQAPPTTLFHWPDIVEASSL